VVAVAVVFAAALGAEAGAWVAIAEYGGHTSEGEELVELHHSLYYEVWFS